MRIFTGRIVSGGQRRRDVIHQRLREVSPDAAEFARYVGMGGDRGATREVMGRIGGEAAGGYTWRAPSLVRSNRSDAGRF